MIFVCCCLGQRWQNQHHYLSQCISCTILPSSEIILGMGSANERRCYIVTSSLIGWAHSHNDPCILPCQVSIYHWLSFQCSIHPIKCGPRLCFSVFIDSIKNQPPSVLVYDSCLCVYNLKSSICRESTVPSCKNAQQCEIQGLQQQTWSCHNVDGNCRPQEKLALDSVYLLHLWLGAF